MFVLQNQMNNSYHLKLSYNLPEYTYI